jgi:ATP-binding cassette subfamily F protein 3
MYTVNNLAIRFSGIDLFSKVSFLINEKDRIGLTGKNGAGKSTLLKLLASQLEPSEGNIVIPKSRTIRYLPQHMVTNSTLSIFEEGMTAFVEHTILEARIHEITNLLSSRTDYESKGYLSLIEELNHANERFYILDGSSREANTEKVLLGLGFEKNQFNNQVTSLSGGWQMRIELAKILLQTPDLILLDEPTNHLDIESIQWLEDFLKSYNGAVVLVSHDRTFLDAVTNRTIEITKGRIYDYKCNYSEYVLQRQVLMEQQVARYDNQQKEIKEVEDFIERFRYKATKAKQVQSRIKQLDKIEIQDIDLLDKKSIHFLFPPAPPSGKISIEIKKYSKQYGSKQILNNIHLTVLNNEFIAFVGRNGEGKTTLAKSIIGQIAHEGEIKLGYNVKIGYYAQNQAELLDENQTVFETIDNIAVGEIRKQIKNILGSFLFSGEDIEKKVKVLSGGERSRLALAKLLLEPVNLLILDEPTNHLDMQSKDILKNALIHYNGTLIIVSHDRDFLKGLTTKVIEFTNKEIKEHLGDITDFISKKKILQLQDIEKKEIIRKASEPEKSAIKDDFIARKENEKKLRKIKSQITLSETKVEELELRIAKLDQILSNPQDFKEIEIDQSFYTQYQEIKHSLDLELENWEKIHYELALLE